MAIHGPYPLWRELFRLPIRGSRSLLIAGGSVEQVDAIGPLVTALRDRFPRVGLTFAPGDAGLLSALQSRLPDARFLYPPRAWRPVLRRYLIDLDVRLLVVLGPGPEGLMALVKAAARRAIPLIVFLRPGDPPWIGPRPSLEIRLGSGGTADPEASQRDVLRIGRLDESALASIVATIKPLLALDLKLQRSEGRFLHRSFWDWLGKSLESGLLKVLLGRRLRRIETLNGLRVELGHPDTILCLGNGPTSEDPRLGDHAYDCLFRVNHMWLDRDSFTAADVVFCGSAVTVSRVKQAIFAFQSRESERRLLGDLLFLCFSYPQRYATLERFPLLFAEEAWRGLRPTNGAAMLATASAVQPRRLIIAGIDLFSHPAGSYPGDRETPNAYTPGHDPDSELALLLEILDRFDGELVILSPALSQAWQDHCGAKH